MALAGELAKYIGGEIVKNTGKELATKAATSALSNLAPKIATKAGASMANKIGNELIAGSVLDKLVPTNRMLDKAGRPVTLYHSTPNNFDKFDDAMLGSNTGYDNTALGHFVTPDKDFSKRFIDIDNVGKTGRTMELQGNIQKPITHPYMAGYKYDNKDLDKIVEDYLLATDNPEFLEELRGYALDDNSNLYDEYMGLTMADSPFEVAGSDRQSLMNKGYDAVEIVEGPKSGLVEGSKDNTPVSSYAVFNGENLRPVRHIPVEESSSLSSIIPVKRKLYRGQQYSNTDFSYNSELMNENPDKWGSKDVGKGYHFTPKKDMAGSWEGSDGGVIEVDYTPDQVLKADDARKMIEEANKLLADDKYMAKLWQENEAMAEQIEKIADGNLEALAKREGKPFVQHLKANDDELGTMYYYKDIDPELTDRFVSEFKQKAEKYMPKRASANGDDMVTLFHNTKAENIPSIMEQGLIPGKRPEGYLASPEEAGIWTDDRGLKSGSYGGTTVKIRVPKKEFDATRVNDTQNLLNRAIKPSEIEGVDYMLYDTPLIKNSNLQEYIDKYGEDKVRELIEKKALVSPEVIDKSFSDLKSGRSLTKPKVQQSIDDSSITLYHGTPNKFEDFDENLPSVWFSDSDKNLKDTGLSIKGGQSMNIMKRQLPKDLKIADEDLADRLTKQQLQDRGYAGIAYTERGPNGDETYYEIFKPNKTLKKMSEVQQSLYGGGYGSLADDAKKIGSAEVAPIDPETLPGAYDKMKDYLADYKNAIPKAIGKPASKITKADLVSLLEDYGYDTEGTKWELWNTAQDMLEDQLIDELYEENGEVFARFLGDHRGGAGITKPGAFRLGSGNRANYLDSVYSDRLGIGRSHTPMADTLNKYNRYGMDTAGGDYMTNGIGINLNSWGNEGEGGVSTIAHERMHAWQDQGKGWNYDERFRDAYEELRKDLEPYFHDREQILKDHPNSNRELDYWARENEQEARMLQSYLENEGFTKTGRKPEWGNEIKPAFDKFYKKLRELSKAGVALPAIALMFGLSTNSDDKKLDNLE